MEGILKGTQRGKSQRRRSQEAGSSSQGASEMHSRRPSWKGGGDREMALGDLGVFKEEEKLKY